MKKIFIFLFIIALIFPSCVLAKKSVDETDEINIMKNARSAILMEPSTGKIIYNKDANKPTSVASLTKMMGLIITFETIEKGALSYDEIITVSQNAKEMGGTQIYLDTGEKISVDDLLKGIVMASANDAMVALAERIAGTEEAFVNLMNKKVQEMGLKNTNFKNCTGFDEEGHFSTAYDMALVAAELLKHEDVLKYSNTYEDYIRQNTDNKTWIVNTNKLVRFYDYVDGLKTGYTDDAGSCIVATAKKDNLRLIAIGLGYSNKNTRNQETISLLDYGFNQYEASILYKKGDIIGHSKVEKAKEEINLVLSEDIIILNKRTEERESYYYEIEMDNINLPIKKGDKVATLNIKKGNEIVKKVTLVAEKDIDKQSFISMYFSNLKTILFG